MKDNIKQMIGKSKGMNYKDSDGDGVINAIDCQPYNKKKQGLIHDIAANSKNKAVQSWGERGQEISKIRREERYKQDKETAMYREKARGEKKREYYKQGGALGVAKRTTVGAFNYVTAPPKRAAPVRRRASATAIRKKTYKPKRRTTTKRRTTKRRTTKRRAAPSNSFNMPKFNF